MKLLVASHTVKVKRLWVYALFLTSFFVLYSDAVAEGSCHEVEADNECVNGEFYSFSVNPEWRMFERPGPVRFIFEASGKHYPPVYGKGPLIVIVAVIEQKHNSLEFAKSELVKTYSDFEDRVWFDGDSYSEEFVRLESGHEAWSMATRFFRQSKGLYQNRYELLTYSRQRGNSVLFSVSIQHADSSYVIEDDLNFMEDFIDPIFRSVKLHDE